MCPTSILLMILPSLAAETPAAETVGKPKSAAERGTLAPELTLKGSSDGAATASMGLVLWGPDRPSGEERSRSPGGAISGALDVSASTSGGLASLLLDPGDPVAASSGDLSVGISLGYKRNYSALGADQAMKELVQKSSQACMALCAQGAESSSCAPMKEEFQEGQKVLGQAWFEERFLRATAVDGQPAAATPTTEEILAALNKALGLSADAPAPGACQEASQGWRARVTAFVQAVERGDSTSERDALAQDFLKGAESCKKACDSPTEALKGACAQIRAASKATLDAYKVAISDVKGKSVDPEDLCPEGKRLYEETLAGKPVLVALETRRYWPLRVTGGLALSASPQKWMESSEDDPAYLVASDAMFYGLRTGLSLSALPASSAPLVRGGETTYRTAGLTVLFSLQYQLKPRPSATTGELCSSAGLVEVDGQDVSVQVCEKAILGAPSYAHLLGGELYLGRTDTEGGLWSAVAGLRYTGSFSEGAASHAVTVRTPVSVVPSLVRRSNEKMDWSGIARLSPYFKLSFDDDAETDNDYLVGLELAMLGRSSLFSAKFDEL